MFFGKNVATNFQQHRQLLEKKDKSLRPKIMKLDEAVTKFVSDGSVVALGGCLYSRTPMSAVHEIIRQGYRDLTIVRNLAGYEIELLLAAGSMKKLIASWCSPGYAWGVSRILRQFVERGEAEFEEWSHLGVGLRLLAAAMGVPSLPTFSMLGSDIEKTLGLKYILCPYTGVKMLMVPALHPDVAIIHAHKADVYGNVVIDGYPHMDREMAQAADYVIVTVEEIVSNESIRLSGDRTTIPFFCVDAVVVQPFGAYPSECWNYYDADFNHMSDYQKLVREKGVEGVREYIKENILDVESFSKFLSKVGLEKLIELRGSFWNVIE